MPRIAQLALWLAALGFGTTGCATRQVYKDHDQIRTVLLDLYTNQIVDNLVRAANGLPIIQIDYTSATAQVTVNVNAELGDTVGDTWANKLTRAAALGLESTRQTVNTLAGKGTASKSNQVSIVAAPLTTSNEVYDAYLQFLTLDGSLLVTCDPPPPGAAHICRVYNGRHYWVPAEFRTQFLGLALATTAQRGRSAAQPDAFFSATIKKALGAPELVAEAKGDKGAVYMVDVEFDKKLPSDNGRVEFPDGTTALLDEYTKDGPRVSESKRFTLFLDLSAGKAPLGVKTAAEFAAKLPLDKQVKVFIRGQRPEPPTTTDLLNRVNVQLQQIQFNQVRTGTGP